MLIIKLSLIKNKENVTTSKGKNRQFIPVFQLLYSQ